MPDLDPLILVAMASALPEEVVRVDALVDAVNASAVRVQLLRERDAARARGDHETARRLQAAYEATTKG